MDNVPLAAFIHAFVSVSSLCAATYAAGVMTLLGSIFVASQFPGTALVPQQQTVHQKPEVVTTNFTHPRLNPIDDDNEDDDDVEEDKEDSEENAQISFDYCSRALNIDSQRCGNASCINRAFKRSKNENDTKENVGTEWWLSSIMTWLPEYSKLTADNGNQRFAFYDIETLEGNEKLLSVGTFITNSHLSGDGFIRETENLITEINWKETLASDDDSTSHDWRYYATKISLGHQH